MPRVCAVIRAPASGVGAGSGILLCVMSAGLERRGSAARSVGMRHGNVPGRCQLTEQHDNGNPATSHGAVHDARVSSGALQGAGLMIRSIVRPPRHRDER
jgi:hypothetical protein